MSAFGDTFVIDADAPHVQAYKPYRPASLEARSPRLGRAAIQLLKENFCAI